MNKPRIQHAYNLTAEEYANKFFHEFDHKPFDRMVLNRFVEETQGKGRVCDMGCGPGEVAAFLHNLGSSVIGIDLSEETSHPIKNYFETFLRFRIVGGVCCSFSLQKS